jgi:hypothetical protein
MAKLFGPTGVKGIDVTTERGTKKYDADKKGFINIDNQKHLKQAVSEGMVIASDASFGGSNVAGYPCGGCAFVSVLKVFTCWKCGTENDHRD